MIVLTNDQMKEAERIGMEEMGVSSIVLMENAALNVVNFIEKKFSRKKNIVVLCGKGNNGGDGYAIARGLFVRGYNVEIFSYGDMDKATPDCFANYKSAKAMGIPFTDDFKGAIKNADIVIDALIGTGLSSALRPDLEEICGAVNKYGKYVIAVDVPTGVNSDTGEAYKNAVGADLTYTFHLPKPGLLLNPGKKYAGKLKIGSIGIPVMPVEGISLNTLTEKEAGELLPKRKSDSNKGSYGKVFAFSGCDTMTGAAVLNLKAAYSCGAGLVYGVCAEKAAEIIHGSLTEAVTRIVPDENGYLTPEAYEMVKNEIDDKAVVTVGSGLGVTESTKGLVKNLVTNVKGKMIIDADGLNCLCGFKEILKDAKGEMAITPHVGEMSRLTGKSISDIKTKPIKTALGFADNYNVTVVLKDAVTIVAKPGGKVYINTTGTSAMSKGGTGDVLAGLISGLAAQGLSVFEASVIGTYISGLAGEKAEGKTGRYGVMASDLCRYIPKVMEKLSPR